MTIENLGATKEACLKEPVIRLCPECAANITLEKNTLDGEIVNCPDCNFELETVFFDPDNPTEVQKLIEIVQNQGSKKGESFDVSRLNLRVSPSLIPAPQEEEDWGE